MANKNKYQDVIALAGSLLNEGKKLPEHWSELTGKKSFYEHLLFMEHQFEHRIESLELEVQNQIYFFRLQQLFNYLLLNPLWKEFYLKAGFNHPPVDFDEWQSLPITDKSVVFDFFSGSRPGTIIPIEEGGFEVVASGGTSTGKPSETVYGIRELHDTYRLAGRFIGTHQLPHLMTASGPKWLMTTLADYQLWSSGTMVGGVLQNVPGINYLGAGPVMREVFHQMMNYPGDKAFMGITQGVAILKDLGIGLGDDARESLKVALYGSGVLHGRKRQELQDFYPNLKILSYFAATQAEAIGLQLDPDSNWLASVPGLHFIEIVDENGRWVKEGEEGELIVTRLCGNESPVLRFKLGDLMIRRPNLESEKLKTQQFEFSGRSGEVLHIGDTQYPLRKVQTRLFELVREKTGVNIHDLAREIQWVNYRNNRLLLLKVMVDDPIGLRIHCDSLLGHEGFKGPMAESLLASLSIFNVGEANRNSIDKSLYHLDIQFINILSEEIFRTSLGKVPILRDII
jgi:phenylacetate-CoA ligase